MKNYAWLLILLISASPSIARNEFISPEQVKQDIKDFYKKRMTQIHVTIHLLDIINAEKDSNYMYVYFLKDISLYTAKNADGLIVNSDEVPVMRAVYIYSHLNYSWKLQDISYVKGRMIFEVD